MKRERWPARVDQCRAIPLAALVAALFAGCASGPPHDAQATRTPELVEVRAIARSLRVELRYATADNFLSEPVYPPSARAFLQRPAAEALARVADALSARGLGLLVYDAYRPWRVTKLFWDRTPPAQRDYVADPRQGSRHNRGCAVDLTLVDLATGRPLPMPSAYDDFSERAHPDYAGGSEAERRNRDTLRQAMEAEGFTVYEHEWWHFDYRDWRLYPVLDVSLAELAQAVAAPRP